MDEGDNTRSAPFLRGWGAVIAVVLSLGCILVILSATKALAGDALGFAHGRWPQRVVALLLFVSAYFVVRRGDSSLAGLRLGRGGWRDVAAAVVTSTGAGLLILLAFDLALSA